MVFPYWRDPICWLSCAAYAVNRCFPPHGPSSYFFECYFNDLLLIPCALPWLLWLHRQLGLRSHDQAPRWQEILFHAGVWSVLFEYGGPWITDRATRDLLDLLFYFLGGLTAFVLWNALYGPSHSVARCSTRNQNRREPFIA